MYSMYTAGLKVIQRVSIKLLEIYPLECLSGNTGERQVLLRPKYQVIWSSVAHWWSSRLRCGRSPVRTPAGPGDFVGPIPFCIGMANYSSGEVGWFSARTLSFHQCS